MSNNAFANTNGKFEPVEGEISTEVGGYFSSYTQPMDIDSRTKICANWDTITVYFVLSNLPETLGQVGTVDPEYRPGAYVCLPIRKMSAPYEEIGTAWISESGAFKWYTKQGMTSPVVICGSYSVKAHA